MVFSLILLMMFKNLSPHRRTPRPRVRPGIRGCPPPPPLAPTYRANAGGYAGILVSLGTNLKIDPYQRKAWNSAKEIEHLF
jgi:hypothetical protein